MSVDNNSSSFYYDHTFFLSVLFLLLSLTPMITNEVFIANITPCCFRGLHRYRYIALINIASIIFCASITLFLLKMLITINSRKKCRIDKEGCNSHHINYNKQ